MVGGIDEVGRGCIAGPVVAAIVVFASGVPPVAGLTDSKKLTPRRRELLAGMIREHAFVWAIGRAEPSEIDRINILEATFLAMRRAYESLPEQHRPSLVLVDGNRCPGLSCETRAIIGGDLSQPVISAASIIAKVYRDREMTCAAQVFPGYGFEVHKGYPTPAHLRALDRQGPCAIHRLSFRPVQQRLVS